MSASHTPGPWHVQDNTDHLGGQLRVDQEQFGAVAICGHRSREMAPSATLHANARLIAAAPELLEALYAVRLQTMDWSDAEIRALGMETALHMVSAAIFKATA